MSHTSLYLCECIPTERKDDLFKWEDMRLNQRKGEKISLLIWYLRLLYCYLVRMGRRHFEWMYSGSLRVLLMFIKTLANYVVFTPSGVLVSIDYVVQFVLIMRVGQFDLLILDWRTVLIGYTPSSMMYISVWPMETWFANAQRRREPSFGCLGK